MNVTKVTHAQILRKMLEREGMFFDNEEHWNELNAHILTHKYYLNQTIPGPISWDEALFSWYENVYKPLTGALWAVDGKRTFPGQPSGALYLAVSNHWFFLKEKNPEITPDAAVNDFTRNYGTGLAKWFSRFLTSGA